MTTAKWLFDRWAYWVLVAIYAFFSVVAPLESRLTPLAEPYVRAGPLAEAVDLGAMSVRR